MALKATARKTAGRKTRRRPSTIAFDALSIEGSLIAPDMVAKIAATDASDQRDVDYETPDGLTLRDEIGRYFRIAEALWNRFDKVRDRDPGGVATRDFCVQLLEKVFGFTTLDTIDGLHGNGRDFPIRQAALGGRVPVVIAPVAASEDEDRRPGIDRSLPIFGDGARRRSATLLLQEALNATDATLWGICLDGRRLRLMRDNSSMTRPAWIEVDLERIFTQGLFADFAALWLLIHQSRFGGADAAPTDCPLERWREAGRGEGVKARERLREGVEEALRLLGEGFLQHRENAALRDALEQGRLTPTDYFQELLRLVYRFIFVFTAEDREVLHAPDAAAPARHLYAKGYSFSRLRDKAVRSLARDRNHDLFEGARVVLRALERGEKRLGLPALGGLFLRERTPHVDAACLENRYLLEAVEKLAWLRDDGARVRVNWRDMETEELGSVYESLLELTPRVNLAERRFFFAEGAETKGNARKTSGSYYTPDSLVQLLLDSALDPVIEETISLNPDRPVEALLDLDIIDPACGSGHFLLAAARRLAARIAQIRSPGSPSQEDYRHALREVARHCLYGVDRNPMAVELCKVALWIETVEPGRPLSFLDSRIRQGDSLIGVFDYKMLAEGVPDEAYKALTGDDKTVASELRKLNKKQREGVTDQYRLGFAGAPKELAAAFAEVMAMPEETLDDVAAKARADAEARKGGGWWRGKSACALYVSAFFMPKVAPKPTQPEGGSTSRRIMIPTTDDVWRAASGEIPHNQLVATAMDISDSIHAFHWPLEFPHVMSKGGFDVVIGNPPWERMKLQEQEFFAARAPAIAEAANKAARERLIRALADAEEGSADRKLHVDFEFAKRAAEAGSLFASESRRFPLTGNGDVNTFALFSELFAASAKQRAGVIVPTAIATDDTTKTFFATIASSQRIVSIYSFYEIRRWFKDTDDRKPFCLLTLGNTNCTPIFCYDIKEIHEIRDKRRIYSLSFSEISKINPNTATLPVFRSTADASIVSKIYKNNRIIADTNGVNEWKLRLGTMFHMSGKSHLFDDAKSLESQGAKLNGEFYTINDQMWVPLYEAKMIHQYDHRWADASRDDSEDPATSLTRMRKEAGYTVSPRYYIKKSEVDATGWGAVRLLGYRRNARTTDVRTIISSAIPTYGVSDSIFLIELRVHENLRAAFLGMINSLVFDYVARTKMSGANVSFYFFEQFPAPPPSAYTESNLAFIVPRVLELTYTSHSMAPFARDLGYEGEPFGWDEDRRAWLRAELDAYYARLYGLTREELLYILDPRLVKGDDYPSETFRVLRTNEERKYGEYRTARLVMQAWDAMEAGRDIRAVGA